jgi:hypothetical protein
MGLVTHPRVMLAASVAVLAVAGGAFLLTHAGGPAAKKKASGVVRGKLTLERFTPPGSIRPELLVSLPGPRYNAPGVVRGTPIVWLRCTDALGRVVVRYPYDWPLLEEVGYPPHIHHAADERLLRSVRRCRLTAPGIDFAGSVSGRLPVAR